MRRIRGEIRKCEIGIQMRKRQRSGLRRTPVDRESPDKLAVVQRSEPAAVADLNASAVEINRGEFSGSGKFFELVETGMRNAVGRNKAVADEIEVVRLISEVAAVSEELFAVGAAFVNSMVAPFPDEPALKTVPVTEGVEIFFQAAVAVAHGVRILAADQRTVVLRLRARPVDDGINLRIHRGDDVRNAAVQVRRPVAAVGRIDRAFAVERTRRIGFTDPAGERGVIGAVAGFVAERPDDDRRVVAVARHQVDDAVEVGFAPARVGAHVVEEGVVFNVRFIENVETELVAEVVEFRSIGIVARADGVDVELLHENQVTAHRFDREGASRARIVLVAVHPLDQNRLAVDQQFAAADLHAAESDFECGGFHHPALLIPQGHGQRVAVRIFRVPRMNCGKLNLKTAEQTRGVFGVEVNALAELVSDVGGCLPDFTARGVEQTQIEEPALLRTVYTILDHAVVALGKRAFQRFETGDQFEFQQTVLQRTVERGGDADILNPVLGTRKKRDIADDSRVPPLVLVFHIRGIAVLGDEDGDFVFAFNELFRNVELGSSARILAESGKRAVDKCVKQVFHAVEAQNRAAAAP